MSYTVEIHPPATAQVEVLPVHAAKLLLEVFAVLELARWSAGPLNEPAPTLPSAPSPFGAYGMVTYLVLEAQRVFDVLDVLDVQWWIDIAHG